jgi:signal transduction histidine kinase
MPTQNTRNEHSHGHDSGVGPSFEERRRFSGFTDEDARLLRELQPVLEREAGPIVERFYENLLEVPTLRSLLEKPATVERLKRAQKAYLISLTGGTYDAEYAESRLKIGQAHERVGLEPQWYIGSYGRLVELLLPRLHEHFADDRPEAVRASSALTKLLLLDMQVVLDAYYEIRHTRELRRSEQLAAVGELAASIAHEVRNPLAGMKGALEVLRDELAVKPSNLEIVDELLAQIARLENLVKDLLTFARPSTVTPREFDLHELLDRLLRMYKDQADAAGITIHRIYGPATGRLQADPQQMEQVFFNLLHNAIQAMEEGGTLTVTTQSGSAGISIAFRDTGHGVTPENLERIFQPFFTTKHRGSGLGLPIVKKIVAAHGGSIEIASVVGQGTEATLYLPGSPGAA